MWGGILILVGSVLLLDHMGTIQIQHLYRFWPLLLVLAGTANLFRPESRPWGVILILVGAALQSNELGYTHFRFRDLWPLLLIAVGLVLMWYSLVGRRGGAETGDLSDTLNELCVFGGIERRIASKSFQGGKIVAIFGGAEIDLRQADMKGEEAVLEANSIFGGCEIRVPESWNVTVRGAGIFGAYVDSTHPRGGADSPGPGEKTLYVKGGAIFGGVEIKN